MRVSAHDKAIAAVMKWAQREEWRDRLDAIIADHLEPGFEEFDLEPDELPDLLGQGGYAQLIGCAFEGTAKPPTARCCAACWKVCAGCIAAAPALCLPPS